MDHSTLRRYSVVNISWCSTRTTTLPARTIHLIHVLFIRTLLTPAAPPKSSSRKARRWITSFYDLDQYCLRGLCQDGWLGETELRLRRFTLAWMLVNVLFDRPTWLRT